MIKIQKQSEAEWDNFLIECFHDAGSINSLIESNYSIVAGRKGTGKTALARYLEYKSNDHGIDLALRISIRSVSFCLDANRGNNVNSIIFFILIKTIKTLLEKNFFAEKAVEYWANFLEQNGLQQVSDYETFYESERKNKTGFSIKASISNVLARVAGEGKTQDDSKYSRVEISNTPSSLIEALRQSLPEEKKIYVFLDDICDHLDSVDKKTTKEEVSIIQDLLLKLVTYNSGFIDSSIGLRFIPLIREDLFEYMQGSNINKLRTNCLNLEWKEEDFACLLIKRLPFYEDSLEESLKDPKEAIRREFPDDIFFETLEHFDTNRYSTNFYAYMVAISFNRPRDFLMFCYAMRERLSMKHEATFENIESAEIEYSDYFSKELRDELFLASRILDFDADREKIESLIDVLSRKEGFNSSELRSNLSQYLGVKTSWGKRKIEAFIQELWWYGILGFKEHKSGLINFRYISSQVPFLTAKIRDYIFFLHRGLYWFSQKRKK